MSPSIFSHPWSTTWKKALVSLPRLVPDHALKLTSPDGPYPFVLKLPSRDPGRKIPVYVFVWVPPVDQPGGGGRSGAGGGVSSEGAVSGTTTPTTSGTTTIPAPPPTIVSNTSTSDSTTSTKPTPNLPLPLPPPPPLSTKHPKTTNSLSLPLLLDFHGGSFILGTPQEQAPFSAFIARTTSPTGCIVLSVDYRLGPYATYPAANHDGEDILNAVLHESTEAGTLLRERIRLEIAGLGRGEYINIDKTRLALSGFSSGGNLALTLAMSSPADATLANGRDWPSPFPPSHPTQIPLLLFYPSLDARLLPDERPRPPGLDVPAGFFARLKLESELMPTYLPKEKRAHPRASPGLAAIENNGLHAQARILLVLPELDSLSAQSIDWVAKVKEAGREDDVKVMGVEGVCHGWTQFPDPWLKEDERRKKMEVFVEAREFLREVWGVTS